MKNAKLEEAVLKIREFNRFYLPKFDLLNKNYLESEYSNIEVRILFEIVENKECFAHKIAKKLKADKGYLSKILKKFEKNGLIERQIYKDDARLSKINPTSKCKQTVNELIEKTNQNTANIISNLNDKDCEKVIRAINIIIETLTERKENELKNSIKKI